MTGFQARLQAAERRAADLERRLRGVGADTRQHLAAGQFAAVAGYDQYRQQPPWHPEGTTPVAFKVSGGCTTTGPVAGVAITVYYLGLAVDAQATTADGFAVFGCVEGLTYTYTLVAGGGYRATSGSFTVPTGGTQINFTLSVASPAHCVTGCQDPISPPYTITDPLGSFTVSNDVFVTGAQAIRALPTTAVYISTTNGGCATIAGANVTLTYQFNPTTRGFTISYQACLPNNPAGYPIRPGGPFFPGFGFTTLTAAIGSATCSPFRWTYSVTGGQTAHLWGVDPAAITLEQA